MLEEPLADLSGADGWGMIVLSPALPREPAMPIFFFDTDDGDTSYGDRDGLDLPDAEAARKAALDALPDMARDRLPDGDRHTFSVTVRDAQGLTIYAATLSLKGEWRVTR